MVGRLFSKRSGGPSIRLRLVALVLMTAAPFVGLIVIAGEQDRAAILQAGLERVADLAQLAAAQQNMLIRQGEETLDILRRAAAVSGAPCHDVLRQVGEDTPLFTELGVATADGRITCSSTTTIGRTLPDPAFIRRVLAPDAPPARITHLPAGAWASEPLMLIGAALSSAPGGGAPALVFLTMRLAAFTDLAARLADARGFRIGLLDGSDGTLLAPDPSGPGARLSGDGPVPPAVRAHSSGGMQVTLPNGTRVLIGVAPISDQAADGPMAVVETPYGTALAAANRRLLANLATAFAALVLAVLTAWLMALQTLLRPLQAIGDAARQLGAGNLTARVAAPGRHGPEFRELAKLLNVTGGRLARGQEVSRRTLRSLAQSEADFRQLASNLSDMLFRLDLELRRSYLSPVCTPLLGYDPEELIGTSPWDTAHPEDAARVRAIYLSVAGGQARACVTYRARHRDGSWIPVEAVVRLLRDPVSGMPSSVVGVLRDVTHRQQAEAAVRRSDARYRLLADHASDLVVQVGSDGRRRYVSPASLEILGFTPEELLHQTIIDSVHPEDQPAALAAMDRLFAGEPEVEVRYRNRRRDGTYVWLEGLCRPLADQRGYVITMRDITHRLEIERQLARANRQLEMLAAQDGLTGLANRRGFDQAMAEERRRAARAGTTLSLVMIDVDYFKRYNDRYGHPAGDACLRDVAATVRGCVRRPSDLAARYGGEEMAVLLPDTEADGALGVAGRIHIAVRELAREHRDSPFGVVTVSVGVASLTPGPDTIAPDHLVRLADAALYRAKAGGRDRVCTTAPLPAPDVVLAGTELRR